MNKWLCRHYAVCPQRSDCAHARQHAQTEACMGDCRCATNRTARQDCLPAHWRAGFSRKTKRDRDAEPKPSWLV